MAWENALADFPTFDAFNIRLSCLTTPIHLHKYSHFTLDSSARIIICIIVAMVTVFEHFEKIRLNFLSPPFVIRNNLWILIFHLHCFYISEKFFAVSLVLRFLCQKSR